MQVLLFDIGISLCGSHHTMRLLRNFASHDRISYGSDSPYAGEEGIRPFSHDLDSFPVDETLRNKIPFPKARSLLPRLSLDLSSTSESFAYTICARFGILAALHVRKEAIILESPGNSQICGFTFHASL